MGRLYALYGAGKRLTWSSVPGKRYAVKVTADGKSNCRVRITATDGTTQLTTFSDISVN